VALLDLFRPSPVTMAAGNLAVGGVSQPATPARHTFAVGEDLATWNALVAGEAIPGRISRPEATSVPAVKRARDLIAGTIGTLPLHAINSAGEQVDHALLAQPEAPLGLVRSVTITRTVEDLVYDAASLWLVLLRTAAGFPQAVERIDIGKWNQDPTTREIRVEGREVRSEDVILFTSPNDPLLKTGARAIRALLQLEQTAAMYADEPEPTTYFRSADGVDPDEETVLGFLTAWRAARKKRGTAYVPSAYALESAARLTPEELTLNDSRSFSVTEVARLTGIDAEELSVSTTSRTYANTQDRRRHFTDFVLSPYLHAVEERLSLGDVTPRGQSVRFNLDGFLRADTKTRMETYEIGLRTGAYTRPEIRQLEDRPPLTSADESDSADG
jgi:hypothetical protein